MPSSPDSPSAKIPASWLKPTPPGYTLPIWRWVLLPATALMLKAYGGVWINGDLMLAGDALTFRQTKAIPLSKTPVESWTVTLADITAVRLTSKLASETIEIDHSGGTHKLLTARSAAFVQQLRSAAGV